MWPLLLLSLAALTVVVERLIFISLEARRCRRTVVPAALQLASQGSWPEAADTLAGSPDPVAGVLRGALAEPEEVRITVLQRGAEREDGCKGRVALRCHF